MKMTLPRILCLLLTVVGTAFVSTAVAQVDYHSKIISAPDFILSPAAEAAGIDGVIKIDADISKDGTVKWANVVAGPAWPCDTDPKDELKQVRKAIEDNLLAAKFSPATKNGKPVGERVTFTFAIGEAYRKLKEKREKEAAIISGKPYPLLIKGGVVNGKALVLNRPRYSDIARSKGMTGTVAVDVVIDEKGNVIHAGATSGFAELHEESRIAACTSKFSPTSVDGKLVRVSGTITYNFRR